MGFVDNIYSHTHTLRLPFHHFSVARLFQENCCILNLPRSCEHTYSACSGLPVKPSDVWSCFAWFRRRSLFTWLYILAAARVRRGGERDEEHERAWREWERERELWAQWPIYSTDLYLVQDTVLHSTVCTCSSPHWPWIRSCRPPWVRLGLGNTDGVFCMISPLQIRVYYKQNEQLQL